MTKRQVYRAIHIVIAHLWGKANKCEKCNGGENSRRFEWSNKDHKYSLSKKDWWQLCAKCHRLHDNKKFGKVAWNKGKKKKRESKICLWCKKEFAVKRKEQILCSVKCTSHHNGNKPKYLKKNDLLEKS